MRVLHCAAIIDDLNQARLTASSELNVGSHTCLVSLFSL